MILAKYVAKPAYYNFQDRPLLFLPWLIAFLLTPGSFIGLTLIHALLIIVKGFCTFLLMRRLLPKQNAVAFAIGALMMVYPAGEGLFAMRNTHLHFGVLCVVLSTYLLVRLWERFGWAALLSMWVVQILGFATYETGIPLALLGPLLLVWLEKRVTQRVIRLSGVWLLLPVVFGLLFVRTLSVGNNYQARLLSGAAPGANLTDTLQQYVTSTFRVYGEHFWTGWTRVLTFITSPVQDPSFIGLTAAVILLCIIPILWYLSRRDSRDTIRQNWQRCWLLIMGGIAAVFLGYVIYLPTIWRDSNWRTFYYSTIGAAMCVVLMLFLLSRLLGRLRQIGFVLLVAPLIGLGTINALNEHKAFYDHSQYELQTLAQIIQQAPHIKPKSLLLIIDHPPSRVDDWAKTCTSVTECMDNALKTIYPDIDFQTVVCVHQNVKLYQNQAICSFDLETVSATYYDPAPGITRDVTVTYHYHSVAAFESTAAGLRLLSQIDDYRPASGHDRYDPSQVIDVQSPLPPKVFTMFSRWPFTPIFQQSPLRSLKLYFPVSSTIRGLGWSYSELTGSPPEAVAWTTATHSTLEYWLAPDSDYTIRFRVYPGLAPDILASLTLSVNGRTIPLNAVPDQRGALLFEGHISREVMALHLDNTLITFNINRTLVPKDLGIGLDVRSLGVLFNWIEVVPG